MYINTPLTYIPSEHDHSLPINQMGYITLITLTKPQYNSPCFNHESYGYVLGLKKQLLCEQDHPGDISIL